MGEQPGRGAAKVVVPAVPEQANLRFPTVRSAPVPRARDVKRLPHGSPSLPEEVRNLDYTCTVSKSQSAEMPAADPQFRKIVALAREFCRSIERAGKPDDERWLEGMAQLLPRLHAALACLATEVVREFVQMPLPDLEARFELYFKLKALLGDRDEYWMEFDVAHDGQSKSGSLADDFTDIYCELKQGLVQLERWPSKGAQVIRQWEQGYRIQWGQHVVDAERHLWALCSRNQLGL